MKRTLHVYLEDILESIEAIEEYTAVEASGLFGLNTCTIRVPMSAEPCPCRGVVGTVG